MQKQSIIYLSNNPEERTILSLNSNHKQIKIQEQKQMNNEINSNQSKDEDNEQNNDKDNGEYNSRKKEQQKYHGLMSMEINRQKHNQDGQRIDAKGSHAQLTNKSKANLQQKQKSQAYYIPPPIAYPKRILQTIYGGKMAAAGNTNTHNNNAYNHQNKNYLYKNSKQLQPLNGSNVSDQAIPNGTSNVGRSSDYYTYQKSLLNTRNISRNTASPIPYTTNPLRSSNPSTQTPSVKNYVYKNPPMVSRNNDGNANNFRKTFSNSKPSSSYGSIVENGAGRGQSTNHAKQANLNAAQSQNKIINFNKIPVNNNKIINEKNYLNYNSNVQAQSPRNIININVGNNSARNSSTNINKIAANVSINKTPNVQTGTNINRIMSNTATAGFVRTAVNFTHHQPNTNTMNNMTHIYNTQKPKVSNPYPYPPPPPTSMKPRNSPQSHQKIPSTPHSQSMNKTAFNFRPTTNGYMRQCNNEAQDHKNYLSKYELVKELGKGTYGVVYLAKKKDKEKKEGRRNRDVDDNMEDSFLFAYGSVKKDRMVQNSRGSSIILQPYYENNEQNTYNELKHKIKSKSIQVESKGQNHKQKGQQTLTQLNTLNNVNKNSQQDKNINPEIQLERQQILDQQQEQQQQTKILGNKIEVCNVNSEQVQNINKRTLDCKENQKDEDKSKSLIGTNNTNTIFANLNQVQSQQNLESTPLNPSNKFINQVSASIEMETVQSQAPQNIESQLKSHPQNFLAIKIYQKFKMNKDPTKFKNIRKQINIMQNIQHPHIIKLYQSVETLTKINIVVQYGGNMSLLDFLKDNYPLSENKQRQIGRQLISAILYLHEKNIVHRDIKLQNILMLGGENVKIIDFGFSTLTYKNRKLNAICGTPNYMAPEILSKKQYIGQYADIWSYGVVMFAVAQGRHPFKAETYNQLQRMVNKGVYQFKKVTNPIHQAFIKRILKIKPQDRPRAKDVMDHPWLMIRDGDDEVKAAEK